VQENDDELDHLQGGQILLPPEILLVLGTHGGHQIVGVHDDVDEGVEHTEEGAVSSRREFDAPPDGGRHDAVVDHVQIGDLIVLLAQHEEDRVQKLGQLAEKVPPAHLHNDELIGIVRVINRLERQTITIYPSVNQTLVNQVDAEDDLDDVVDDDGRAQFERLPIAHQFRSQRFDEIDVTGADGQRVEGRAHQKPAVHPRIFFTHEVIVTIDDIP